MTFIFDNAATIIICCLLALCVCLAVRSMIKSHKSSGCGGACSGCPKAGKCRYIKEQYAEKEKRDLHSG